MFRLICVLVLLLTFGPVSRAENPDGDKAPYDRAFSLLFGEGDGQLADPDKEDIAAALAVFREEADTGNSDALNALGMILRNGWFGVPEDAEAAESYFRRALQGGSEVSRKAARINLASTLAMKSSFGDESWREIEEVARPLLDDEALGAAAAALVGQAILLGPDNRARLAEAEPYLLRGMNADPLDPQTRWLLARGYDNGWFGEPDAAKACELFRAAAKDGDSRAYWNTGMCFLEGPVGPADEPTAFAWVQRAADAGDQEGMISLAVMYALGQGTDVSVPEAAEWYERAIRHGGAHTAHALRGLGAMHLMKELGDASDPLFGYALLELAAPGDGLAGQILGQVEPLTEAQRAKIEQAKQDIRAEYSLEDAP